jgi:phosphonate transport system permease protein
MMPDQPMTPAVDERPRRPPAEWHLNPTITPWMIGVALVAVVILGISAERMDLDRMVAETAEYAVASAGFQESSQIGRSTSRFVSGLFPFQISNVTEVALIQDFDRDDLPWFSHLEQRESVQPILNPTTLQMESHVGTTEVLVEPIGYLGHVLMLMVITVEIAFWATVIAVLVAIPLAFFGSRNLTPHPLLYNAARAISSFLRAMPELILAMIFVLAFGFGPIAGILALGLHCAGFFGKFFADDAENADRGPQEALIAAGANRVKVARYAIIPQVWPQYVAYLQYILERNIRSATVIGLVGAGGIGLELKGRFDLFNYHHVATILLVIFLTVLVLEQVVGRLRSRLL